MTIHNNKVAGLAEDLVRAMCEHPDDVEVFCDDSTPGVAVISVRVNAADMGLVIGTKRANYNALSTILQSAGIALRLRVNMTPVLEPTKGSKGRIHFRFRDDWGRDRILALLRKTCDVVLDTPFDVSETTDDANHMTAFTVTTQANEKSHVMSKVGYALGVIFDCIGRTNGRIVNVIVRKGDAQPQPESAAGRHSGEVER